MVRLSDTQQRTVMEVAARLPPEKRETFLHRVEARLIQHGSRKLSDYQVAEAAELALASLMMASGKVM